MQCSTWFYSRVGVAQFASQLITHYLASVRMPDGSCRLRQSGPAPRSEVRQPQPDLCCGWATQFSCRPAWEPVVAYVRVSGSLAREALNRCDVLTFRL
jgi:hypothetical protein